MRRWFEPPPRVDLILQPEVEDMDLGLMAWMAQAAHPQVAAHQFCVESVEAGSGQTQLLVLYNMLSSIS